MGKPCIRGGGLTSQQSCGGRNKLYRGGRRDNHEEGRERKKIYEMNEMIDKLGEEKTAVDHFR